MKMRFGNTPAWKYTTIPCKAAILLAATVLCLPGAEVVSEATTDARGFRSHWVESEYQEGKTEIKVLLPDRMEPGKRYRVLYVLPVEGGDGNQFGHGLEEVRKLGVHNQYGLICVYPTFSQSPWFADNPLNARIRQESYFVKTVAPFVEREYPALREPSGRLLVGFSKSGWGAFSLLLRWPQTFGKAAAWDAPVDETNAAAWKLFPDKFGTAENLQNYRIDLLLEKRAAELRDRKRLVLMGYGTMREMYQKTHERMVGLKIPHDFVDGPHREHRWDSGWLAEAVKLVTE